MIKFVPFRDKQQYLEWAQATASGTELLDKVNPARIIAEDIAQYDPVAAELFLKNAAAMTELSQHLKKRLETEV